VKAEGPIVAVASGTGGAIAVLRVSGPDVIALCARCLPFLAGARVMRYGRFLDPASGETLDDVMAAAFPGPRSFTGEDSVEIFCHGGPYVIRRLLSTLYALGIRAAEPGEFTRRAFLNGKLDLTAAEGVRALVEAESEHQWKAARHLATGKLKDAIDALRTQLVEAMAYLEAQIDFPDEGDTAHLHTDAVKTRVTAVRASIERLLATYDDGKVAARGLSVALLGEPNAGKSTLMNALLGRERAIVSDIAGTTRDYLEEPCLIEGRLIRLFDMAGVRDDTTDTIEQIGVATARRLAAEADLVLFLAPSDRATAPAAPPFAHVKVVTKSDLPLPAWADSSWLPISVHSSSGLAALRSLLASSVDSHVSALREDVFITSARHAHALRSSLTSLDAFFTSLAAGAYEELLAFELQTAARALEQIIGRLDSEDILDKVFSEFCIGK
jgi:tRNA modification GTPase